MKKLELTMAQHVDCFFVEWMKTLQDVRAALERKDYKAAHDTIILNGMKTANYVNRAGYDHLRQAARILLKQEDLSLKVKQQTAIQCIIDAFSRHLEKAKKTKIFSEHAVVSSAISRIREVKRANGIYIVPVIFSFKSENTDFWMGPARIVSSSILNEELDPLWHKFEAKAEGIDKKLGEYWRDHSSLYKHFILVNINGFESEKAWVAARETSDLLLNIIRMYFRYQHTDDMKVANGYHWQNRQSSLWISDSDGINLSSSLGGGTNYLEDEWQGHVNRDLFGLSPLIAGSIAWLASGSNANSPIRERLSYANRLIAEAYSEPHDPIRLVRLVSALETLAVSGGKDIAHNLAYRCGCAGGWSDPTVACQIYDVVRRAYNIRSAIVHGDAPGIDEVRSAFFSLEEYMMAIYLGFLWLMTGIFRDNRPQSIRALRKFVEARIDWLFWNPDLIA